MCAYFIMRWVEGGKLKMIAMNFSSLYKLYNKLSGQSEHFFILERPSGDPSKIFISTLHNQYCMTEMHFCAFKKIRMFLPKKLCPNWILVIFYYPFVDEDSKNLAHLPSGAIHRSQEHF